VSRSAAASDGTIAGLTPSVRDLFQSRGWAGLEALPSVGPGIAGAIAEILVNGRWSQLDRPLMSIKTARERFPTMASLVGRHSWLAN
jgi:hypothetical protein